MAPDRGELTSTYTEAYLVMPNPFTYAMDLAQEKGVPGNPDAVYFGRVKREGEPDLLVGIYYRKVRRGEALIVTDTITGLRTRHLRNNEGNRYNFKVPYNQYDYKEQAGTGTMEDRLRVDFLAMEDDVEAMEDWRRKSEEGIQPPSPFDIRKGTTSLWHDRVHEF